jgi:hypothetical protein
LGANSSLEQGLRCLIQAIESGGPNRGKIREVLASGTDLAGVRFLPNGELQ